MDNLQPFGAEEQSEDSGEEDAALEPPPSIGNDERRMHVRAYNHWASLLEGRAYPSIESLEPDQIEDFGPHGVLLDFTAGVQDPAIAFLGKALRTECEIDETIDKVADVPGRSLLSRLTDHYMQIIANRAPVGFEAEFVNDRGLNTMYRGILMPFSSDDDTIDFIYGVINWKEVADTATERSLHREVEHALSAAPAARPVPAPVWADGPRRDGASGAEGIARKKAPIDLGASSNHDRDFGLTENQPIEPETLADRLVSARESAEEARNTDRRSRAALYEALGEAYDFALAAENDFDGYEELLDDAGIKRQARAPLTPVVKLIFGASYDKTRITEFAAALAYAKREGLLAGSFANYLTGCEGGLKAVVAAERALRRPAVRNDAAKHAEQTAREATIQGFVTLGEEPIEGEFALLMARRMPDGRFAVLGSVPRDKALINRAIRKFAR